jgi:cell division septation protein DedD
MSCNLKVTVICAGLWVLAGCGERGPRPLPYSGFQVSFKPHNVASEMASGQKVAADIAVKNVSPVTWPSRPNSKGRYAVNLSYHWLDNKGAMVVFDGLRTPLPRDLKSGESVDLKAEIQAPANPGRYILEVTLVQESSAWFPEKDGAKLVLPVTVIEDNEMTANGGSAAPVHATVSAATEKKKAQPTAKTEPSREPARLAAKPPPKETTAHRDTAQNKLGRSGGGAGGPWSVQVGSYTEKRVASALVMKLQDKGYDAYVVIANIKGTEWHRVRVGHLKGRADAEKLRDTLRSAEKFEHSIVSAR